MCNFPTYKPWNAAVVGFAAVTTGIPGSGRPDNDPVPTQLQQCCILGGNNADRFAAKNARACS